MRCAHGREHGDPCDCATERPADPAVAFALEHALQDAARAIARLACGATVAEGAEIPRERFEVATSRVYTELLYRVRQIAPHLPGSWRRLEAELGAAAGEEFLTRSIENPSGASLHVERDGNGRVAAAWVEPARRIELPRRAPQSV